MILHETIRKDDFERKHQRCNDGTTLQPFDSKSQQQCCNVVLRCNIKLRESSFWNPENVCLWSRIREKFCLWNAKFLGFGIRNKTQWIQNPSNDCNPESKFHWQRLKSNAWNPESTAWNLGPRLSQILLHGAIINHWRQYLIFFVLLTLKVDEVGYRETVIQTGLKKYWDQIKAKLGIDWTQTSWQDLEKPLYSGLASRLFLARLSPPIPTDLSSQAQYWKTHYNTVAGSGTVQKFIDDVKQAHGCAV